MKIVKPSVELIWSTSNPERVIERCGRICYQSQHKVLPCGNCVGSGRVDNGPNRFDSCGRCNGTGTDIASAIAFVEMIKKNGHESVIEHASASFDIVCDRGISHETVRHRLASYSMESTRYCNYSKEQFGGELTFIEPPGLRDLGYDGKPEMAGEGELCAWAGIMEGAEHIYCEMISRGVAPQIARSVLPNSLKTEIAMTANFREWRHFLRLRTSPKAHPQMREIAEMIRAELLKISKVCFEDIP